MFKLIQNKIKKIHKDNSSEWNFFNLLEMIIFSNSLRQQKNIKSHGFVRLFKSFFLHLFSTKNKEFLILIKVAPSQTFFSSMSAFDFKHTCTKCILALIITKNAFHSILISTINYHDNMNISYTYILCWWYEIVQESV